MSNRIRHKGALFSDKGVSALCFKTPRAIDMRKASWCLSDDAVTCEKCLVLLKKRPATYRLAAQTDALPSQEGRPQPTGQREGER